MRRADRLFQLVQYFRRRRKPVPAHVVAEDFGVCVRTIYRDLDALAASGVPIRGEVGVGYQLERDYFMPPVTFSIEELEAISLGISMVSSWTDDKYAKRAAEALQRITDALPRSVARDMNELALFSVPSASKRPWTVSFSELRQCIADKRRVHIQYGDAQQRTTARDIRPLGMVFFGPVWLVVAWCELREDFRTFRLDRIAQLKVLGGTYPAEPEKSLSRYIEIVRAEGFAHTPHELMA